MNREKFLELLKKHGIDGYSPRIPIGLGHYNTGEFPAETFISVPETDTFPLPETTPHPITSPKDLEAAIVQAQYEHLCEQINKHLELGLSVDDLQKFEPGREFSSPEEFIQFKQSMLTYYNDEAQKIGWSFPIQICAEPTCINMAIPSFSYCSNHLSKDPNFTAQPFIKVCTAITETGQPCGLPAPASTERCIFHGQTK